jgi:hypothetical protein
MERSISDRIVAIPQDRSLRAIARHLNDVGNTTRRGRPWNPMQVSRMLRRLDQADGPPR